MAAPALLRPIPNGTASHVPVLPQSSWAHQASVMAMFPRRIVAPPVLRPAAPGGPTPAPPPASIGVGPRAPWFENAIYRQHLNQITNGSRALGGNVTNLLVDGPASFSKKIAAIRGAKTIFLKMYQFDDDESGRAMAAELSLAAQQGCKVFVQYGLKSFYNIWDLALIKMRLKEPLPPVLRELATHKENVVLVPNDRPSAWLTLMFERDHEKYLITHRPGEPPKLIMGGMNISDAWMRGGQPGAKSQDGLLYRDTDVEVVGPTVESAIRAFIADMGHYDAETLDAILDAQGDIHSSSPRPQFFPPGTEVRFVRNKPHQDEKGQYIKALYISLLQQVPNGETVRIANPYMLPQRDMRRALVAAANRGVRIEIVINALDSPELEARLLSRAAHSFFRTLLRKTQCPDNFVFYEFTGNPLTGHNTMHQKVASFGAAGPCIVGSSNLDEHSLHYNREAVALVYGTQFRAAFDAMWQRDLHGTQVSGQDAPATTTRLITHEFLHQERRRDRFVQHVLYRWAGKVL